MARFLKDMDYNMQIRAEIKRLFDGSTPDDTETPPKLLRAEHTAISQIRNWLTARYDCDAIFAPAPDAGEDTRDQWIVTITIDMALYHLYAQTGWRDIPEHRKHRYQDALDWLKSAGEGNIGTNLPALPDEDNPGDIRIGSKYPLDDNRW